MVLTRGAFPPFVETRVFVSNAAVTFDEVKTEQYLQLMMATDLDTVRRYFPKVDGKHSLGELRKLFADLTVLGRFPAGDWCDTSRNGMITGVSVFKEFLFSKNTASLGMLGGTPGARAALRAAAKAEAKAKAKSAASSRRRDAFLSRHLSPHTHTHMSFIIMGVEISCTIGFGHLRQIIVDSV